MANLWTKERDDEVIRLWQEKHPLYDIASKGYADYTYKTNAFVLAAEAITGCTDSTYYSDVVASA